VREWVKRFRFVNLIAATTDDARDITRSKANPAFSRFARSTNARATRFRSRASQWPNGARSLIFTADEPVRLRGKQHEKTRADELCAWRYPDAWDQAMFGLRLGG